MLNKGRRWDYQQNRSQGKGVEVPNKDYYGTWKAYERAMIKVRQEQIAQARAEAQQEAERRERDSLLRKLGIDPATMGPEQSKGGKQ